MTALTRWRDVGDAVPYNALPVDGFVGSDAHIAPAGNVRSHGADRVVRPYVRLSVMLCNERGRSMIRRAGPMCPAAQYALIPAGHAGPALQRGAANRP